MAEPPAPEEVWEEILLRVPPDDPASLLRASIVCKEWRRIASRRGFLRRLHELHRAPPLLGFFSDWNGQDGIGFIPTSSGFRTSRTPLLAFPERLSCARVLDCRHGRALLVSTTHGATDLIVWEPVTGYQRRVPVPAAGRSGPFNAAVVCAGDGCEHWDCHGGPFRVVFVHTSCYESIALAWEFSSETGAWGEPIQVGLGLWCAATRRSILVGSSLYFLFCECKIFEYDLGGQGVVAIDPADAFVHDTGNIIFVQAEDGRLGIAGLKDRRLHLWSRQRSGDDNADSDAGWVLRRIIHLENHLPAAALSSLIGFAEEANVIFLRTNDAIFTVELISGRVRELCCGIGRSRLLPFFSFYAPGLQADA